MMLKSAVVNAIVRCGCALVAGASVASLAGEDPYVEFTGTQCVDTGYHLTGDTAVVADFQMTDTDTLQQLVWSAGPEMWSRLYVNSNKEWSWSCMNRKGEHAATSDNVASGIKVDGDRVLATVDGFSNRMKLEKGGQLWYEYKGAWTSLPHSETNTATLKLGCRFAEERFYAKMKLYAFKIYEAGELVRDYVPATCEGIVGLYDRKNGGFVYDTRVPLGTGEHALGAGGPLPAVESGDAYVESDGTSAMNARLRAFGDVRVEVDFAFRDIEQQQRIFGADGRPCLYINYVSNYVFTVGPAATIKELGIPADTLRHTAVVDYAARKLELRTGPTVNFSGAIADGDLEGGNPMPFALFGNMNANAGTYDEGFKFRHRAKARIYGARFFRAGQLVHDYHPCVKGGVVGFRDRVGNGFICGENADAFTAGGKIERVGDDPHVILTGNNGLDGEKKWINTGYCPGPTSKIVLDYALADNYPGTGEWFLMAAWTAATESSAAERLNFAARPSSAVQWRNGTGTDWASLSSKLGAATEQRNVRRQLCYDAASGTCVLSTAGFTNVVATSATTLTRRMSSIPLRLGTNTDGVPGNYAPLKIYGLKIYEDDVPVHDFTPYVQNGVVGLKDVTTGVFVADGSTPKVPLDAGGTIETDDPSGRDAYVEFTGAQSIDTGIKPTGRTAVVADFQLMSTSSNPQQFIWGSSNDTSDRIYTSSGKWAWFGGWDAVKTGGTQTGIDLDFGRLQVTVDPYNKTTHFDRAGVTLYSSTTFSAAGTSSVSSIKIGSRFEANNGQWNFASMKLYSFKIYEAGELVRDYVPYVQNGVVGLWEKVQGAFAPNMQNGDPLKIGGMGADLAPLVDVEVPAQKSRTLSAAAAGAIGYQWFVNGERIEGAEGPTYTVAWRPGTPDTDMVKAVARFDVFGVETVRETNVTVTYAKRGFTIIFR